MNFVFEQLRPGGDRNLGYLVGDRAAGEAVLVDPSFDPKLFVERAKAQRLRVKAIVNTHGHTDHTNGNEKARKLTGAPVAAWRDAAVRPDLPLDDGSALRVGTYEMRVLFVPGHAPDHVLLHLPEPRVAITGDLLFVGKIGGTGTREDARTEYDSLGRVLRELPDDTTIWPGHDYGARPSSTIALEKLTNPFLLAADFEAFFQLKETWADFKASHGLR